MLKIDCLSQEKTEINTMTQEKSNLTVAMFAAGVAHELANPLDAVGRYVNLALERAMGDPVTREYLLKAKKGIFKTGLAMNELVAYSRQCHGHPAKIIEIHSLLNRSLNEFSQDEKFQGITIQKIFCEDSIYVED